MSDGKKHSLLSPSASTRWINCPPSARLTENCPDNCSAYASEGTIAHAVAEAKLRNKLGMTDVPAVCEDVEMDECTDGYVLFVLERLDGLDNPRVFIEQRVDCSGYVRECAGTCDALIVSDGVLSIVDFKFGRGTKVEAEGNDQLRLYALGALEMFGYLYDISIVRMSIYQPRIDNCSTWEIPRESLERWAEDFLRPAAELAWFGNGEYRAGDHCKFCKAKAECRARAEENLTLARYDFKEPALLDRHEIAAILVKLDGLTSWASDIKGFALAEALKGVKFSGFKTVEGRSNRRYISEAAVAERVKSAGLDPFEHNVLGVTKMEQKLGKRLFAELLDGLIMKPPGKPTLVPETDRRQEIKTSTCAASDFADS